MHTAELLHAAPELVGHDGKPRSLRPHVLARDLARGSETDDLMCRERARSQTVLLSAPKQNRLYGRTALPRYVERSDALGPIQLVRGKGEEIHGGGAHVQRQLAGGLCSIRVKQHAALPAKRSNGTHFLNDADLVTHVHDGNEHRVRAQRLSDILRP